MEEADGSHARPGRRLPGAAVTEASSVAARPRGRAGRGSRPERRILRAAGRRPMPTEPDFVESTTATTTFEAELLVGALKALGISAVTSGGALEDTYYPMGIGGGLRVMVPREEIERARRALPDLKRERPPA